MTRPDLVRTLATVMAVACAVAAVASIIVLFGRHYLRWSGVNLAVVVAFPAALVVAVAGPRVVVGNWQAERELAAWALMYFLPFAAALAISALMERFAAVVVAAAVASSAAIVTVGASFLESVQPWGHAQVLVFLSAVILAASRCVPARHTVRRKHRDPANSQTP